MRLAWKIFGLLSISAACSSGGIPSDAKTTVLSFPDLDCGTCGEDLAKNLIREKGVHKVSFDKNKAEITIIAEPEINALELAQSKKPADEEWHLVEGAGKGGYIPWAKPPEGADVRTIAENGQDVADLTPHLAPGKVTLVDFSAKWCEPCRELDEHVLKLVRERADIAYRKLDVADWDTPLGKHYLTGVKALPYVLVFDKSGKQIEAIAGLDLAKLESAIERAAGPK